MLIKVTNMCHAGCSHCMESSTPAGQHMTEETFEEALDLSERLEEGVMRAGMPLMILLSGGECTEHPQIIKFIERVYARGHLVVVISNGSFLNDPELKASILRKEWSSLSVQITNDPRFYPIPVPACDDPRIIFIPALTQMMQLGRFKDAKGLPLTKYPPSFNLRSLTRTYKSVTMAIAVMRARTLMGKNGFCSPNITEDGVLHAGETRECWPIGSVDSSVEEITDNLLKMGVCNKCHLESNLSMEQKRAIGLSSLYGPTE